MQHSVATMIARVLLGKVFVVAVIQINRQETILGFLSVLNCQLYLFACLVFSIGPRQGYIVCTLRRTGLVLQHIIKTHTMTIHSTAPVL